MNRSTLHIMKLKMLTLKQFDKKQEKLNLFFSYIDTNIFHQLSLKNLNFSNLLRSDF